MNTAMINNMAWKFEKTNYNTSFLKFKSDDISTKDPMMNHMAEDEKENKNVNH